MKKGIVIILFSLFVQPAGAQDSSRIFTIQQLFEIVKKYHPVAKQAAIQAERAAAEKLSARGGFDPLLNIGTDSKTFDGTNYYKEQVTAVTIPTWYGIEFQTGIQYLEGSRTDPQETVGKTNFTRIAVPLAKNLLMDKRRAALLVANQMLQYSIQEKNVMLNDLLKEAADAYWSWQQAWLNYNTYSELAAVNEKRVRLVKTAFEQGDRPAIDSTEALAQLQNIQYLKNESQLALQNASLLLSLYLWKENSQPYELPADTRPDQSLEALSEPGILTDQEKLMQNCRLYHPEIKQYENKIKITEINKRLKFQELLPKLDLKYTIPGKGYDLISSGAKNLFTPNNQKFALSFSMPLRLREGRGAYRSAKLKMEETKLQFDQKTVEVQNKLKRSFNQLVNYQSQLELLKKMYRNQASLQRAEETRFLNGESSLFLVNARENKTLETRLKLTETAIGYNKLRYTVLWAAGILWRTQQPGGG